MRRIRNRCREFGRLLLLAGLSIGCAASPHAERHAAPTRVDQSATSPAPVASRRVRYPAPHPAPAPSATIGRVVRVIDGDTFELLASPEVLVRVRLAGIDAPEKSQPFSRASREALAELIAGRPVRVDAYKKDPWGRLVGNVFRDDVDVGLALISLGLAWHFKRYAAEQSPASRTAYASAETEARLARIGLWSAPDPIAPWRFRARDRLVQPR